MKEKYVTITGMNHYYGLRPFSVGKKVKCIKDKNNSNDSEAIKVVMKDIGKEICRYLLDISQDMYIYSDVFLCFNNVIQ